MAEITIDQTTVTVEATDTAVNVLPIVSQVVIETATSATLAVVDPINYDNATIGLNIGNNLTVVAGDLTTTQVLDDIDKIAFDTAAGATAGVGELAWNDTDGTLNLGLKGGNVTLQIGQELVQLVKDADNAGIANGAAYYLVGSDGSNVTVRKAQASTEPTSSKTFGIATESSTGGAKAFLTTFGMVRDIDTSALTEGAIVWLSPTVAGGLTTTKPSAPNHAVMLGLCVKSHANNGMVFVSVNNGLELEELHNVAITSVQNNDLIAYDSATSLWKNVQLSTLGDSRYARLGAANAFTVGGHTITNADAAVIPLKINAHVSQSELLFQIANSSNQSLIDSSNIGYLRAYAGMSVDNARATSNIPFYVRSSSASTAVMWVRGAPSQTADLQQWQNSSGSILALVNAYGSAAFGGNNPLGASLGVQTAGNAAQIGIAVRGAASQSADLQQWQDNTAAVKAKVGATGDFEAPNNMVRAGFLCGGNTGYLGDFGLAVVPRTAANVGILVRGAASQASNLQVWQNSASTTQASVGPTGTIAANSFQTLSGQFLAGFGQGGGYVRFQRSTAAQSNPGANLAFLYVRDGTNAGTLKLVVRAGAAGAETTVLDNIPQ